MKKFAIYMLAALLVLVFRSVVLMFLWDWFVTEVFHVSPISFLQVLGLNLVLSIFTRKNISENTKDALTKTQNELDELESQVVMLISSEFLSLVATLVFGFVIHVLGG